MQLNPLKWFGQSGRKAPAGAINYRATAPEGPWAAAWRDWVPREVNPWLLESIREAVAPIDGAINRLTTLDGILRVEGGSDRLVAAIEEWMSSVQVNDLETGFQAFYRSQSGEFYEQGFSVGEPVVDGRGGVVRLRVADSKGVAFRRTEQDDLETWYRKPSVRRGRRDGTDQIERVLRNSYQSGSTADYLRSNDYRPISAAGLVYAVFNPEADGPYGTSIMRSTEFDARVLLVMKNSLYQVWERFGNPVFKVTYKTKAKLSQAELDARRATLATNLQAAMNVKKSGNSADFVNAIGKDDELEITILGADGQVLEIEMPARHILESIVAKTGLPSWMLAMHWSTAERLAQRQGEIALQESKTRFETRKPALERVIAMHLRATGQSWKRGDWQLVQELPSLQDLVAQAQATFLYTQSAAVLEGAGLSVEDVELLAKQAGIGSLLPTEGVKALAQLTAAKLGRREGDALKRATDAWQRKQPEPAFCCDSKGHGAKAETYVEDEAELMRLERSAERALLAAWDELYGKVLDALNLDRPKSAKGETVFVFDRAALAALLELEEAFVAEVGAEEAALARSAYQAWLRGVENGAAEFEGMDEVSEDAREAQRQAMAQAGMEQVRDTTARALRADIIGELERGAYDGSNPMDVARALRKLFEAHEYDWERLARSEIAQAQAGGKLSQYAAHGVEEYDWVPAGDSCPICDDKAASGPYAVGAGPLPMRDSHPNCRCTVVAVA